METKSPKSGAPIGSTTTLAKITPTDPSWGAFLTNHAMGTVKQGLASPLWEKQSGTPDAPLPQLVVGTAITEIAADVSGLNIIQNVDAGLIGGLDDAKFYWFKTPGSDAYSNVRRPGVARVCVGRPTRLSWGFCLCAKRRTDWHLVRRPNCAAPEQRSHPLRTSTRCDFTGLTQQGSRWAVSAPSVVGVAFASAGTFDGSIDLTTRHDRQWLSLERREWRLRRRCELDRPHRVPRRIPERR